MTREKIEKVAQEYADIHWDGDFSNLASRCSFISGARWRINSVWHDNISECKDVKRRILVEYSNGYFDVLPDVRNLKGVEDLVVSWAYVEDLLPERKEDVE